MAEAAVTEAPSVSGQAPSAGASTSTGATAAASPTASAAPLTDEQILGIGEDSQATATGGDARATEPLAKPEAESGAGEQIDKPATNEASQQAKVLSPEIKEFFKTHPEVRDAYYRAQEFGKLFPDFKAAQAIAELAGNYESPEQLAEDLRGVADLQAIDRMWYSKDPAQHSQIIENLAADDPEALQTMAEALPDVMRRVAPDAYKAENTRRIGQILTLAHQRAEEAGEKEFADALDLVAERLLGRSPWAPESLREQQTRLEQERAQIAEQRQQLAQSETERWIGDTNHQVVTGFVDAVKGVVDELVPAAFSAKARQMLVGEIYRTVDARLQGDSGLVAHVRALTKGGAGDPSVQKQIVRLVTNQAKRLIPEVARDVVSAFSGSVAATTQQRQATQAQAASRVDVTGSAGLSSRGTRTPTPQELRQAGKYRKLSDDDIIEGRF